MKGWDQTTAKEARPGRNAIFSRRCGGFRTIVWRDRAQQQETLSRFSLHWWQTVLYNIHVGFVRKKKIEKIFRVFS